MRGEMPLVKISIFFLLESQLFLIRLKRHILLVILIFFCKNFIRFSTSFSDEEGCIKNIKNQKKQKGKRPWGHEGCTFLINCFLQKNWQGTRVLKVNSACRVFPGGKLLKCGERNSMYFVVMFITVIQECEYIK